jgi:hypothetical protein
MQRNHSAWRYTAPGKFQGDYARRGTVGNPLSSDCLKQADFDTAHLSFKKLARMVRPFSVRILSG